MTDPFDLALLWTARLAGLAAVLGAVELWRVRGTPIDQALDAPEAVAERGPWAAMLGPSFPLVLALQLCAGLVLLAGIGAAAWVVAVTITVSAMRFRGPVSGGSDAMLFTVCVGLGLAATAPSPAVREAGLLYIAVQLTLSYVRAGLVKMRERDWWRGTAMQAFVQLPAYGVPAWATRLPLRAAGIGVMLLECAAPLAWLGPRAAATAIVLGTGFHAATVVLFGLSRFLWAWGAAYPALWWAVTGR